MPSDLEPLTKILGKMPPLKAVVATHFHVDHVSGWIKLQTVFENSYLWLNDLAAPFVDGRRRIPLPGIVDYFRILRPCMQELALIQAREGICAVLGNHDHKTDPEKITEELQRAGICVLRNENKRLRRGNSAIQILGVDDLVMGKDNMKRTLDGVNRHEVQILMSHSPDIAENYKLRGIDLILCGHTHGGQIYFPLIGAPQTRFVSAYGQKYISGLVQYNDIQIYINRGIGAGFPPARFLCKPEITVFTLKGA